MKCFLPLLFLGAFYLTNAKPVKEHLEIIEGDMLLTKEQKMIHDQLKGGRVRRAALKDQFLWPKGRVFYTFKDLDAAGEKLAKDAIDHWEDKTCLNFTKRTNETVYVEFQYAGGCRAVVGYGQESPRLISIGEKSDRCKLGSTIHEIGHAIGFFHEHVRPDRDQFVTVNYTNMRAGEDVRSNFEIASEDFVDSRGEDYDYASIMHYSRFQGNNAPGAVVLQPKQANVEIGQRDGLSQGDIDQTKKMYKCNDKGESEFDYVPSPEDQEQGSASGDQKGPKPGEIEA